MKGLKKLFFVLGATAFIASCTPAIEKDAEKINSAEATLFSSEQGSLDRAKALALVDMYIDFANKYPEDSMASEYLFKGAEFCLNLGEGQRAIELYDRVITDYPDFRKVPECMFLKGYVYENYLGDLDNAKIIYLRFLEDYPDNEFADDAAISIQNLGKTPEELIRQFEEQQSFGDPE
jgi:outer membrane protein assembly factor BamD (BamD/ComL family)